MNREGPLVQTPYNVSKEALQNLWETCFPEDADGFAKWFLERYYTPSRAVCVLEERGTLESALYWLPCWYQLDDQSGTFLYIYAMGTHPDFRKKGNLRRMLNYVEQYCIGHGIDGILLRAMETSKSSVESFGMKPLLSLQKAHCTGIGTQIGDWCAGTYEDFERLRMQYFSQLSGCISWDEEELRFIYEDLCQTGKLVFFREGTNLHYGVLSGNGASFCVEETDCEVGLLRRFSGPIAVLRPGTGTYGAHVKSYTKSLQEQDLCKLYFNLMLK